MVKARLMTNQPNNRAFKTTSPAPSSPQQKERLNLKITSKHWRHLGSEYQNLINFIGLHGHTVAWSYFESHSDEMGPVKIQSTQCVSHLTDIKIISYLLQNHSFSDQNDIMKGNLVSPDLPTISTFIFLSTQ